MELETPFAKNLQHAFRSSKVWLVLLILAVPACQLPKRQPAKVVPLEVRLYDLTGSKRLVCSMLPNSQGQNQGFIRTRDAEGENFQGEWMQVPTAKTPATPSESKYASSIPILPAPEGIMELKWGWSADLGIDFRHFPDHYFSFMLYGDSGTLISGFFLDRASSGSGFSRYFHRTFQGNSASGGGLLGAATDNKGHRYKLMG